MSHLLKTLHRQESQILFWYHRERRTMKIMWKIPKVRGTRPSYVITWHGVLIHIGQSSAKFLGIIFHVLYHKLATLYGRTITNLALLITNCYVKRTIFFTSLRAIVIAKIFFHSLAPSLYGGFTGLIWPLLV